jgi:hypothetical protein
LKFKKGVDTVRAITPSGVVQTETLPVVEEHPSLRTFNYELEGERLS